MASNVTEVQILSMSLMGAISDPFIPEGSAQFLLLDFEYP